MSAARITTMPMLTMDRSWQPAGARAKRAAGAGAAIDHGGTPATGCPAADQRGVSRPRGPARDIGAVEVRPGG